jgi:hypothetical protein
MYRERVWKSLRILDLFLSTSMGRPPALSDIDCTVPYRKENDTRSSDQTQFESNDDVDILNSCVQVFQIMERVIVEVYSRKQVSVQLAENIARQLRDWTTRLPVLLQQGLDSDAVSNGRTRFQAIGTCQVLCSYYYTVMLLTRPFLLYQIHLRLLWSSRAPANSNSPGKRNEENSGKAKLANACVVSAIRLVELVRELLDRSMVPRKMPLIVLVDVSCTPDLCWSCANNLLLALGSSHLLSFSGLLT